MTLFSPEPEFVTPTKFLHRHFPIYYFLKFWANDKHYNTRFYTDRFEQTVTYHTNTDSRKQSPTPSNESSVKNNQQKQQQ